MTGGVTGDLKVAFSLTSPVSWLNVPQVEDCQIPQFVREKIDTTVFGIKKFKRSMPGFNSVSDMTLKVLADLDELTTPSHSQLMNLNVLGTTIWWRVEIATNRESTRWKAWEFQAYVGDCKPAVTPGGKSEIDYTIVFDGEDFTIYPAGASAIS